MADSCLRSGEAHSNFQKLHEVLGWAETEAHLQRGLLYILQLYNLYRGPVRISYATDTDISSGKSGSVWYQEAGIHMYPQMHGTQTRDQELRTDADGGHGEGAGVIDLEGQREDSPDNEAHCSRVEPGQHPAQHKGSCC